MWIAAKLVSAKRTLLIVLLITIAYVGSVSGQSGLFVGGGAYYNRDYSINEIKSSGFTNVKIWTIHINYKGDLDFNTGFLICKDGEYVGDDKYPHFRSDVKILKEQPTSVVRIEFGLSAWGSSTFDHIKTLVETEGTGENSILYKNFKALKEAIPEIDAINNDDEKTYDLASTVAFSNMLADLGYQLTGSPYRKMSFWQDVVEQVNTANPGSWDIMYLQCYAGGTGNNPCTWQPSFDTVPIIGGLWGGPGHMNPSQVESQMTTWEACGSVGGFMWIYDDFDNSPQVEQFADAINTPFGISPTVESLPFPPSNASPADEAEGVSPEVQLSWSSDPLAEKHLVYFDTTYINPVFVAEQTETIYNHESKLDVGLTYYWRVDEIMDTDTITGQTWHFTIDLPIGAATNPDPANNATNINTTTNLMWSPGDNSDVYYIYLENVCPPTRILGITTDTLIAASLVSGTTYYWQVKAQNTDNSILSDIFTFTTGQSTGLRTLQQSPFFIYPNPNKGILNIQGDVDITKLEVINANSQRLLSFNTSTNNYDISKLPAGYYTIRINGKYINQIIKH